jgi:hypothetical protein
MGKVRRRAAGKVVEYADAVPVLDESVGQVRTDEPGASGDQVS